MKSIIISDDLEANDGIPPIMIVTWHDAYFNTRSIASVVCRKLGLPRKAMDSMIDYIHEKACDFKHSESNDLYIWEYRWHD